MKDYVVYFEIYGKKMKVTVPAFNEDGAKKIVQGQLKIHKIEPKHKNPFDSKGFKDLIDTLKNME